MFSSRRWSLVLSYIIVMAGLLGGFGTGVYLFFRRSLDQQMDKKLLTLAQAATSSFEEVQNKGQNYLDTVEELPWRDIFNRDEQSLEWFNAESELLGSRGKINLKIPPVVGGKTVISPQKGSPIRTYTISVFKETENPNIPSKEGYIRASQSMEELQVLQEKLLWGLVMGGGIALVFVGIGGFWLAELAIKPIERSLNQLKQFTADASHELRTPLTAIKASVDVMRNHPERIHPKDTRKLTAIASATDQMRELLEDLLFLARMDGDLSHLPREWSMIEMSKILQELVVLFEPLAQEKKITLESEWLGIGYVFGNEHQLKRLFANLLGNALKYTPAEGKVVVSLFRQNRFIFVFVKDTGIGISKEQLELIFDRFWRADRARKREGGTGLGLAIAQAIAQLHGGKITVESKVGVGSCFKVRLLGQNLGKKF